ncbi:replication-relaxation family protein [Geodermatophilus sp. DSM 45219]|uniref:replication-relaxation family protein n=1 Tax=Geodermatophilus sp. DSM 45219 TaxID=1881103 RepID=UPI0015A0A6E1|nr:replication-relaxation family protein [Geodermatophilus sp. DSM 45219]
MLLSLAACRLLTTGQLQRLHFADHATEGAASRICRRVLARLQRLGVIEHLDRRIGGVRAGSASYVWRVGPVGERLLRQDEGAPRGRHKQPGLRFVDHVLAVAECSVQLVEADRRGDLELLATEHEPACWRGFLGAYGGAETLKPDLYAVTATTEYEDSWFIEVDRSTESLPTLLKKCAQYERYQRTGREQEQRGVFPAVLWVVPDDRRAGVLVAAIRRRYGTDQELFRVTTAASFVSVIVGAADPPGSSN